MNKEKIAGFRKFYIDILIIQIEKFKKKLNFISFIGAFKNMPKKSFLALLGLVRQYNSPSIKYQTWKFLSF